MRIIAGKTLRHIVEQLEGSKDQKAVKSAMDAWYRGVLPADWEKPSDGLKAHANASVVGRDRVVSNLKAINHWLVAGEKSLSLNVIRNLQEELNIPAEVLIQLSWRSRRRFARDTRGRSARVGLQRPA